MSKILLYFLWAIIVNELIGILYVHITFPPNVKANVYLLKENITEHFKCIQDRNISFCNVKYKLRVKHVYTKSRHYCVHTKIIFLFYICGHIKDFLYLVYLLSKEFRLFVQFSMLSWHPLDYDGKICYLMKFCTNLKAYFIPKKFSGPYTKLQLKNWLVSSVIRDKFIHKKLLLFIPQYVSD